ncbi:MAG: site-specific integrase [Pirellulaceae bacterium]
MPIKRKPSYLLHKPTGQARVRIDGKDHYLGPHDSPESRERYEALVTQWLLRNGDTTQYTLSVDDLALLYIEFASSYYRKPNGEPTSEITSIRHALRPLIRRFGTSPIRDFGPRKLKQVREDLIRVGHCRTNINRMVDRIKRMFTWGVSEEYVAPAVASALSSVKGLRKGRTNAEESRPVEPVDDAAVQATLPHLPTTVAAMVRLQLLTGSRPGEICAIRPCDITQGTDGVWRYVPEFHKTEHHGKQRRIFLGPQAQEVLRPYLDREPHAYCFSPQDSERERNAARRAARKSKVTPSQQARKLKADRARPPMERYTKDSYRRAVQRACELAFGMPKDLRCIPQKLDKMERTRRQAEAREWRRNNCWTPNQLRHNRATELRRRFGIEAARTVLGHASPDTTLIYAEADFTRAADVMREIG